MSVRQHDAKHETGAERSARAEADRSRQRQSSRAVETESPERVPIPPIDAAIPLPAHPTTRRRGESTGRSEAHALLLGLQRRRGNRYVRDLLSGRRADGDREVAPEVEAAIERQRGSGPALERSVRDRMEPIFGADFSAVRVHTDAEADRLNRRLEARAFTTGSDVYFRQGEYAPGTLSGTELLAHELTHVVQQTGGAVRRRMTMSQPGDPAEREAELVAKEVVRLDQKSRSATGVARQEAPEDEDEKEAAGRLARQEEPEEEERAAALAREGEEEEEEEGAAARRLGRQEEPEDEEEKEAEALSRSGARETGERTPSHGEHDPAAILAELGPGRPLESGVRSRMEPAFGESFDAVRVHTGPNAAAIVDRLHAHAFTVGQDVGFAAGRYRPGTLMGDALLAHELAHTIQQRGARAAVETLDTDALGGSALEADANRSALGAMRSLWGNAKDRAGSLARAALPRLRSGLRVSLRDCVGGGTATPTATIGEVNAPNTPSGVKRIPPRVNTEVEVTVSGASKAAPVVLSVDGASADNGKATINDSATHTLTKSAKVKLKGTAQTSPGKAGNLKLIAKHGSTQLAASNGFSVAAYPKEVGFNFNSVLSPFVFKGKKYWGAKYDLTFQSDSNTAGDCDKTKVSENVLVDTATGYWSGASSTTSGFIRTTSPQADHHATGGFTKAADMKKAMDAADIKKSKYVVHQFFRFSCERTGVAEDKKKAPKVPTSGFKVTRTMSKTGAKYYIHVKKEGFANNGVAAGPVDDSSVKDAEVKD